MTAPFQQPDGQDLVYMIVLGQQNAAAGGGSSLSKDMFCYHRWAVDARHPASEGSTDGLAQLGLPHRLGKIRGNVHFPAALDIAALAARSEHDDHQRRAVG